MSYFEQLTVTELDLVEQLRREVSPLVQKHAHLQLFCTDWTYVRYLRARLQKLITSTLATQAVEPPESIQDAEGNVGMVRTEERPHEIRWKDIEVEAMPGKIFVSPHPDKEGRSVLVMRPRHQNTTDARMQVLFLIYCLEHACKLADMQRMGKMTILIDFEGYNMRNAPPMKVSSAVLNILQNHYPERLGLAVCYHAPTLFSFTWKALSPFIDPVTHKKIQFVNKGEKNESTLMAEHFHLEHLEECMGGKLPGELFRVDQYRARCLAEDADVAAAVAAVEQSQVNGGTSPELSGLVIQGQPQAAAVPAS